MHPARDHSLPPDPEAWRRAEHPRGRVIVIAPTRAACETIELALHARVETLLARAHGAELRAWARAGKGFGIVAGTGTGKTLAVRFIAEEILGQSLTIGVVNREREATPETTRCNVVVVTTGIPHRGRPGHERFHKESATVMKEVAGLRRTGSAALDLAWTAAGRFDAYWERGIQAWDLAAGIVIVREAGGFCTDLAGGERMLDKGEVLAANKEVHRGMLALVGD